VAARAVAARAVAARAVAAGGGEPPRCSPIKGIRVDQGQRHAEKRSNRVRSPLIGEGGAAAGAAQRDRRPAKRRRAAARDQRGPARRSRAIASIKAEYTRFRDQSTCIRP
jgi:hypothetical protein